MAPVITRAAAGLPPLPSLATVARHPGIILHCTAGTRRPLELDRGLGRVRIIQHAHTANPKWIVRERDGKRVNVGGRGWKYGGYHFVILPGGAIVEMRGFGILGAHAAKGAGRNRWLGVVLLGRGDEMTEAEQHAFEQLHAEHQRRGGGDEVIPHNAISEKACPGPAPTAWVLERYGAPRAA